MTAFSDATCAAYNKEVFKMDRRASWKNHEVLQG